MELDGTTLGLVLTALVAFLGLVTFLAIVVSADMHPIERLRAARAARSAPQAGQRGGVTSGREAAAVGPGQGHHPAQRSEGRHQEVPKGRHPHGTLSSWLLVAVVTATFIAGGFSIVAHAWVVFWVCVGVAVLAVPAGKMTGIMNDTVSWTGNPAATEDPPRDQGAASGQQQPETVARRE